VFAGLLRADCCADCVGDGCEEEEEEEEEDVIGYDILAACPPDDDDDDDDLEDVMFEMTEEEPPMLYHVVVDETIGYVKACPMCSSLRSRRLSFTSSLACLTTFIESKDMVTLFNASTVKRYMCVEELRSRLAL
jgi:hypothetical protein